MPAPKINAWWTGLTAVITFFIGTIATPVSDFIHKERELDDRERDFVMRVVELEVTHPSQAVSTAALTASVAHQYLRHKSDFADSFSDVVAAQALMLAGQAGSASAGAETKPADGPKGSPTAADGAAAALGQVAAAATVAAAADSSKSSGATRPPSVEAVLTPTQGRVFFQIAEEKQRPMSAQLRWQLGKILAPISVNGDELVASYKGATEVRYFYSEDLAEANRIASTMKTAFPELICKRIGHYEGKIKPRLFEVWLGPGAAPKAPLVAQAATPVCQ